jgi:hypothetical protein
VARRRANQQKLSSPVAKNIPLSNQVDSVLSANRPSPREGRIAIVTDAGWDAVDAAASGAIGNRRAGSSCERVAGARTNGAVFAMPEVSTGLSAEALAKADCVRQNRVVPTPVAGVKLSVAVTIQPDRISHQAGSDGDKTNSSPGRARHKP